MPYPRLTPWRITVRDVDNTNFFDFPRVRGRWLKWNYMEILRGTLLTDSYETDRIKVLYSTFILRSHKERELFFESVGVSSTPFLAWVVWGHGLRFFHILFCAPCFHGGGNKEKWKWKRTYLWVMPSYLFFAFLCFVVFIITYFSHFVKHRIKLFSKTFHTQRDIPIPAHIQNTCSIPAFPTPDRTTINIPTNHLYIK